MRSTVHAWSTGEGMEARKREGETMLYMKTADGKMSIVVLETANIEEIKKGRPAKTPDGSILIAWTPDPVWLADKIMDIMKNSDGDARAIGAAIDEAAKRPQKPTRPYHKPYQTRRGEES